MTSPTFGDPKDIARYTVDPNHVYEFYELAERPNCPDALSGAYYATTSDIAMINDRSDPSLPKLWKAVANAEKALRAWAEQQGYRVTAYGMKDDEGS